jgi:hypothetical protein
MRSNGSSNRGGQRRCFWISDIAHKLSNPWMHILRFVGRTTERIIYILHHTSLLPPPSLHFDQTQVISIHWRIYIDQGKDGSVFAEHIFSFWVAGIELQFVPLSINTKY